MITISNEDTNLFSGCRAINRRMTDGNILVNASITGVRMFKFRLAIFKYIMVIAANVIGSNILVKYDE